MTKEENVKLAIKLIQASLDGKTIEYKSKVDGIWDEMNIILDNGIRGFNFQDFEFRIKPEKKLVPFTWEDRELFRGKWVMDRYSTTEFILYIIEEKYVSGLSYKELFEDYMFLDGSPCGKEVEE